ncbi:protein FAN isoform X3 [Hydra vulgaris]|uniref:Protein FAN isoform X3 n=1 Tax=Hydra vulgaris TaxID=6087 RepID=A0ABM4DNE7_HYDVU
MAIVKETTDGIKYFWKDNLIKGKVQERFNLLLLEPAEIYFEDFSAYYYSSKFTEDEANQKKQKGRIKICSKSVLFDPLDSSFPLLKFLYKDCIKIQKSTGQQFWRIEQKDFLQIESNVCIQLKESNILAPYKYIREPASYFFSLNFVNMNSVLPKIEQLIRAHTLNIHTADEMIKTIVEARQAMMKFDKSWVEDLYENIIYETTASKITPLVCNPGKLLLTSKQLYYQPFNNVEPNPVMKIKLSSIHNIIKRRYLQQQVGLEIVLKKEYNDVYFVFQNQESRDCMFLQLSVQEELKTMDDVKENMTMKWQNGVISNFDYLIYLNSIADRSFNDLTQYPVFPWIIKDYKSSILDLNNPDTFRDLTKPIGALDEARLSQLKQRMEGMPEPKFLYGSHYSSPGFVLYYLVRAAPEYMLCLQNGKFDNPDRLFNSILATWNNCCTGHSDFKELIPEFYNSDGTFLENVKNLDLGKKQDGTKVNNVQLPPWAKDSKDFIRQCREALECDYVSQMLHHWIDLIFGYKQTGVEAWNADNVFYYLTYEGAVEFENITNSTERYCLESQILEFGQTPKQLFTKPHPRRQPISIPLHLVNVDKVALFDSPDHFTFNDHVDGRDQDVFPNLPLLNWYKKLKLKIVTKLHKDCVLGVDLSDDAQIIYSVSQDCQLKVFSINDNIQTRSINLSSMALSCCQLIDDQKYLLIGSWDAQIYIYSTEYSRVVDAKHAHHDAISSLCYKYNKLVTSSWDATVKVWSYEFVNKKSTFTLLSEIDHDTEVSTCDYFEDSNGSKVVTGTKDGHVLIWNNDLQILTSQLNLHASNVTKVIFSPNGAQVLSSSLDGYLKIIDSCTELQVYAKDVAQPITNAFWDGFVVIATCQTGNILIFDIINDICISSLTSNAGAINSLAVNVKMNKLITGHNDGSISVWIVDDE